MTIGEALGTVRYVLNAKGEWTDVLIPLASWKAILASWKAILASWKEMMESLEDQEDSAILQAWLENRDAEKTNTLALDALEEELVADGLLPS